MPMDRYRCLDYADYNKLQFRRKTKRPTQQEPLSLAEICCHKITSCGAELATEAATTLPCVLAAPLLRSAIGNDTRPMRPATITAILANWPTETICFREILTEDNADIFQDELGFDLIVFRGVTARTDKCRIRCIDLRGFSLNWTFTRLIIQMWPILSLKKSQRNVKRLTDIVTKKAGLKKENRLSCEIIPQLIKDLLNHEMITHPSFGIQLGRGEKLLVRLDRVEFTHQNTFFMDYLITNCLREVTPLTIVATNVIINSELSVGDSFLDSLAPFIIFRGHSVEAMEGLCLENLEDTVFFATCSSIHRFEHLVSLALLNCNICLQEGRTRRRTAARTQVTELLSALPNLHRLDLSQNSFAGCLSELLESCRRPLDFLALNDSDLSNCDMDALAVSKHACSIRELNVSRICGLYPDDAFAVKTTKLVETLEHFPNLTVLWIAQNQISDYHVDSICQALQNRLKRLKALHLTDNLLSPEAALKVIKACVKMLSLRFVHVAFTENILNMALHAAERGPAVFKKQVEDMLKGANRTDLVVNITSRSYAIFGLPV